MESDAKRLAMRVNLENDDGEDHVLAFRKGLAPLVDFRHKQTANVMYTCVKPSSSVKRSRRFIAKSPERILDAPGIRDDFYASLVDWSLSNMVAVGLDKQVYIWDAEKGNAELLVDFKNLETYPTLIKFSQEGKYLTIGLNNGQVKVRIYILISIINIFLDLRCNEACLSSNSFGSGSTNCLWKLDKKGCDELWDTIGSDLSS